MMPTEDARKIFVVKNAMRPAGGAMVGCFLDRRTPTRAGA
jgi:hypothetical protein